MALFTGPGNTRPTGGAYEAGDVFRAVATLGGVVLKRALIPILRKSPIGFVVAGAIFLADRAFRSEPATLGVHSADNPNGSADVTVPPMWLRDP